MTRVLIDELLSDPPASADGSVYSGLCFHSALTSDLNTFTLSKTNSDRRWVSIFRELYQHAVF